MPGFDELLCVGPVVVETLALSIGAGVATYIRALIPLEAKPAQGRDQPLFVFGPGTCLIGVLGAEQEAAAMSAREGQVEQGDVSGTDVGCPRGRRSDTNAHVGHGTRAW